MDMLPIRKWISLCQVVRKLPASKQDAWRFIVETSGLPLDDRILLGQAALSAFGRHWQYFPNVNAPEVPDAE